MFSSRFRGLWLVLCACLLALPAGAQARNGKRPQGAGGAAQVPAASADWSTIHRRAAIQPAPEANEEEERDEPTTPEIEAGRARADRCAELVRGGANPAAVPECPRTAALAISPEGKGRQRSSMTDASTSAPTLGASFPVDSLTSSFPPDSTAAVGPTNLVVATNQTIKVFDKSGALLQSAAFGSFFAAASTDRAFDPKLMYDQYLG